MSNDSDTLTHPTQFAPRPREECGQVGKGEKSEEDQRITSPRSNRCPRNCPRMKESSTNPSSTRIEKEGRLESLLQPIIHTSSTHQKKIKKKCLAPLTPPKPQNGKLIPKLGQLLWNHRIVKFIPLRASKSLNHPRARGLNHDRMPRPVAG